MATYQSALRRVKRFGISAGILKLIAMLSMLADHFAVVIIKGGKLYGYSQEYYEMALATAEGQQWMKLYDLCRFAGRLSLPLFCFLLVQGFLYTSDLRKYLLRMLILALVSELPYDLAMYNSTYEFARQNVCFTLLAGLLVLYGMRHFRKKPERKWACVLLGCAAVWLIHADYGIPGVLMIAFMYNFRREKSFQILSGAVISGIQSSAFYGAGALAFIPIWFYSGEKGLFQMKWFTYLFYPLHLLIFYIMVYIGAMFG